MYLSRLIVNGRDRIALRDFSNAHALHQRIMQAFPDQQRQNPRADWNVLYRQEPESDIILIQSDIEPNWEHLPASYLSDRTDIPINVKSVNLQTQHLAAGKIFQFRLKANPSKRDKDSGKTIGLFRQPDQLDWLTRQAARSGFTLHGVDVIPTPDVFGFKGNTAPIRLQTALFQGVFEVTDSVLLLEAIRQGIGRGKAYGCGLLSIARLS